MVTENSPILQISVHPPVIISAAAVAREMKECIWFPVFVMLCNVLTSTYQTLNLQVPMCAVCLHVQLCSNLKVCVHIQCPNTVPGIVDKSVQGLR